MACRPATNTPITKLRPTDLSVDCIRISTIVLPPPGSIVITQVCLLVGWSVMLVVIYRNYRSDLHVI